MRGGVFGYANVLSCVIKWSAGKEAERAARFCVELMTLHIVIPLIIDSLAESYSSITRSETDRSARGLLMKKFVVIRTEQDVAFRVYAYREKLYELVNIACAIGVPATARRRSEEIRRRVKARSPGINAVLETFETHDEMRVISQKVPPS